MDSRPNSDLIRSITQSEIASFVSDGVVHLPEILDIDWIYFLRTALEEVIDDPNGLADLTELGRNLTANEGFNVLSDSDVSSGRFLSGVDHWKDNESFAAFAKFSPLPLVAAELMNSKSVYLYEDSILVKEPGTSEKTAFHQDLGYFHLEGEKICTVWAPLDEVDSETGSVVYLRSSHKSNKVFKPNWFVANESLPNTEGNEIPKIEMDNKEMDLIRFDTRPGDLIVHHAATIHGAGANHSISRRRRAVSVRYCGDGVTYKIRPGAPLKAHHENVRTGDPVVSHPDCPLVWGN